MDLTIVIPVYRNEATIGRTLASIDRAWIESQRPEGLHVVIVVDGVIDLSLEIIGRWRVITPLANTVIVQDNAGVAHARNVAWRAATTTWVTFLDADDEITAERLRYAETDAIADVVHIGCQVFDVKEGLRIPGLPDGFIADQGPTRFHPISMLIERSAVENVGGFNPTYHTGEDWDFFIRLCDTGIPVHYVDQPFLIRHIHGDNLSMNEPALQRAHLRAIREHHKRRTSLDGEQHE